MQKHVEQIDSQTGGNAGMYGLYTLQTKINREMVYGVPR